jgi:hypothetical protein
MDYTNKGIKKYKKKERRRCESSKTDETIKTATSTAVQHKIKCRSDKTLEIPVVCKAVQVNGWAQFFEHAFLLTEVKIQGIHTPTRRDTCMWVVNALQVPPRSYT